MDIRKVKKLIDLVKETGVSELEINEGEESVKITLGQFITTQTPMAPIPNPPTAVTTPIEANTIPTEPITNNGHTLRSPMVGTVFLAPTPGAKPFFEIGQRVAAGDTLCLIEAMKMFNQVEADKSGVISACLVENSNPVEFDQPLFVIEEA
ncbi:MAG: acetyl-CoA carboxylase biotin carboxyl carrier protein [Gammaproteobacteria bacterium]|nr:acetyl-CoA carboxylase biotin carboxyl carrier protein [Gammaproteobacteria bacterium]